MIKINITRTYYPHWGGHSGVHQYVQYLDHDEFNVRMNAVPMGDDLSLPRFIKNFIKRKIEANYVSAYELNDYRSELSILNQSLFGSLDIVHLLDGEHSLMFLPDWLNSFGKIKKVPKLIAMFHQPADILEKLINKDIVQKVDCVLVVAPEQVAYFRQFMPEHKVKMILHGIDTDHFIPGSNKDNSKFRCVAAGVWLRDYDAVIATARLLREENDFEFHVIATKFTVPDDLNNIIVHRNISDAEMLKLYQSAHVLFMPLKTATANNVLLEGSACGLPVISTAMNSVSTYFPGDEAVLVDNNHPEKFAEILQDLRRDKSKLEFMSLRARERSEELSWQKIAREYAALYRALSC